MDELDRDSAAALWGQYVAEHPEHADDTPPLERFAVVWPPEYAD
jgi:hypothetical protein